MISATLARVIVGLANFYMLVIFVYVLMSWIPHDRGFVGEIYQVLATICEPYLRIFRVIPPVGGMMDISPIIAVVVLQLVVRLIVGALA